MSVQGWPRVPRLVVFAGVAFLARAITFGSPIVQVDEEFYYTVAHAMARGALPYVDIWDRKPFGLFVVYLPAGLFDPPVGVWVYQAMALAAVVATAWIVARLAERAGWRGGAVPAAILYILWLNLADGQGGQAPVFYNLTMVAAAWLVCRAITAARGHRGRGVAAMALVGISLQIKYSVVFEGLAFGLWLLWDAWGRRRAPVAFIGYAAVLGSVALLPTLLVAGGYWLAGHEADFFYANFSSILARHADPIGQGIGNLVTGLVLLAPLLVPAIVGPGQTSADGEERRRILFLRTWLGASVFGFAIFGSWFNHYTLPVMVPAACCAAGFLSARRSGRKVATALIALGFVAGQIVLWAERNKRGSRAEFAALVQAIGRGPGALYVYQGSPILYPMTGRPALTRYIFSTHLMLEREQGAVGVDQAREVTRIIDALPEVVVMQSRDGGEDFAIRAVAEHGLVRNRYRMYARLPLGNKSFALFRR